MKTSTVLLLALATSFSAPAFAGEKGQRCNVRHIAGEWLTAFEYGSADEHDVACRLAVGRDGAILRATCLQDTTTEKVSAIGSFAVDNQCQFTGELTVGAFTFKMNGELSDTRDLMVGLITQGVTFEPFTLIRSGNPSKGRPSKPGGPIDGEGKELELSCVAQAEGVGELEVQYEVETKKSKVERSQFHAEFEAEGDGLVAGQTVALLINGGEVASRPLAADDDDGDLGVAFRYNSRRGGFPDGFPTPAEGTTVAIANDGTPILSCTLEKAGD